MSKLAWPIFAVGLSVYVISLVMSPWDFSEIELWLVIRFVLSTVWAAGAVGLVVYAFNIPNNFRAFWTATKYAWVALGCFILIYGWATNERPISSVSFLLANLTMVLVFFGNFVALDRLAKR
jgi:hypothetical protein